MKTSFKKNAINIALGATAAIASIAALNKYIFMRATQNQRLRSRKTDYFSWRYGKVYYEVKGSGAPLLLIHSVDTGSSSYNFHRVVNKLSENYTVYTIDLLGYGRSDKPEITYTNYLYVQLITDFIKTVIKRPTHVIASSMSCSFVTLACHQNKKLFEKLMFINPPRLNELSKYPGKLSNIKRKFLELPLVGTSIYNTLSSKASIRSFLYKEGFYNPRNVSKRLVDTFYEAAHLQNQSNKYPVASYLTHYMHMDVRHALSSIDQSMYIVTGETCESHNRSVGEEYNEQNLSIEYSTIPKTKLFAHLERHDEFLEICSIFF